MPLTPEQKTYIASQLKKEHPELQNATDDEVIQVTHNVELPDASPDEWDKVLLNTHTPPEPEKKPWITGEQVLGGVAALGLGALGGALHAKMKAPEILKGASEAAPEVKAPENLIKQPEVIKPVEVQTVKAPVMSELAITPSTPTPEIPKSPTSTRSNQTFDPVLAHTIKKLESDPDYQSALQNLGGGKTVTHEETLAKVLKMPSMQIDELANWKAGTPVNEVDIVRAGMLRVYWMDEYLHSLFGGAEDLAQQAHDVIKKIEPGYHNITATPGRSTEIQKIFQISQKVSDTINELEAMNTSFEQKKKILDKVIKEEKEKLKDTEDSMTMKVIRKIEDYSTSAKLTSLSTHGKNTVSNGLVFVQRALEKTADAGQLQITGKPIEAEAALKYAWGTGQGWIDATRKFTTEITSGKDVQGFSEKIMQEIADERKIARGKEASIRNKTELRPGSRGIYGFRWTGRLLTAADNFWQTIIHDSEMNTKAFIQASEEGLKENELADRIDFLLKNPPPVWKEEAINVAKEYTFHQDASRGLRILQNIQSFPLARIIFPFVQTPFNILKFYGRRSIFGILSPSFYRDMNAGGIRRTNAISRLMIGYGFTGAAFALVNTGVVTGPYPENPKERALWTLEKRKPWSIKVGNYWVNYNALQPVGAYLATAAAINQAYKDNQFQKAENKLGKLLNNFLKGPLDLPFLQGVSSAFELLNDAESNTEKFIELVAQGLIPNIVRDVRNQIDPVQRKPENLLQAIENVIPGLSKNVPARIDVLGNKVEDRTPRIIKATKMATRMETTDKTKLFEQLGWTPPSAETTFDFQGTEVELKGPDKELFLTDVGKAADHIITKVMADPVFQKADNTTKKRILHNRVSNVQTRLEKAFKAKFDLYGTKYEQKGDEEIKKAEKELGITGG